MVSDDRFFIELDFAALSEKEQTVSGDVCLQRRNEKRTALVLANGGGSGVKANVVAGVISSMAVNYAMSGESPEHAARAIVNTFRGTSESEGYKPEVTLMDIRRNGVVHMVEFGAPEYILFEGSVEKDVDKKTSVIENSELQTSDFEPSLENRIIIFSDGVAGSGRMTKRLPEGWGKKGVTEFCRKAIEEQPEISARELCRKIVAQAEMNDLFSPRKDMTCAVVYFRKPRKIIVSSGPPYNENKDQILADMVDKYDGSRLICGGTTARIISRELGREVNVVLKRDPAGLPPVSQMEGVDLITEGVLTLSKVKNVLEKSQGSEIPQKGTDGKVARMLLEHDIIEFVVGTRINPVHQDPNLPVELELRRNLIKELAAILENKFMKDVKVKYI